MKEGEPLDVWGSVAPLIRRRSCELTNVLLDETRLTELAAIVTTGLYPCHPRPAIDLLRAAADQGNVLWLMADRNAPDAGETPVGAEFAVFSVSGALTPKNPLAATNN